MPTPAPPSEPATLIVELRWTGERGRAAAEAVQRIAVDVAEIEGAALLVELLERAPPT